MILLLSIVLAVFVALIIIAKGIIRDQRGEPVSVKPGSVLAGIAVVIFGIIVGAGSNHSIGVIQPGSVGVVIHLGKVDKSTVLSEGPYFVTPFVSQVVAMDTQTRAFTANAEAASKDIQTVNTQVTVNYSIDPKDAPEIYDTLRNEYSDRITAPAIQETVKACTAPKTAEELITKRAEVRNCIDKTLIKKIEQFGIKVVAVSVSDFKFSDTFNQAVEDKVKAQQNALTEAANYDAAVQQAKSTRAQADADAYKQRAMKQSLTPEMVQLEWIKKWDGHLPTYSGASTPFINVKP